MMRERVEQIFGAALKAVDPYAAVKHYAQDLLTGEAPGKFTRIILVGFGKASCPMAKAVEDMSGALTIYEGAIVTKYGHRTRFVGGRSEDMELSRIRVFEASHPIPDEHGLAATEEIMRLCRSADERSLLICLVSGGGSALLVSPYDGISLAEKQTITDLLLRSGADITELNAVRKHLSRVKGGRLAQLAFPAEIRSLMISDVIGDSLNVIASGPTAPDSSTFHDALDVISKYDLTDRAPAAIMEVLKKGRDGLIPETAKEGDPIFDRVQNVIISNNRKALEASRDEAVAQGFSAEIVSSGVTGEARHVGKSMAQRAQELKSGRAKGAQPLCLISGGETTVTVKGSGKGGRNTELALSFAMEIEGFEGITLLSAGTDGTDGPTDAAGAVVDGQTVTEAKRLGLTPLDYLEDNDSYGFFSKSGSLLITGPTGTNVMDVQIVVIE